jgi:hypothetical protein
MSNAYVTRRLKAAKKGPGLAISNAFALSPQSVAIIAVLGRAERQWLTDERSGVAGQSGEMLNWVLRGRRNKGFTGIYNELHDSGETFVRFGRSLVVSREATG